MCPLHSDSWFFETRPNQQKLTKRFCSHSELAMGLCAVNAFGKTLDSSENRHLVRIFGFCLEKTFSQLRSCNLIYEDVAKQLCHIRHSNDDADRNKFNERSTLIELTQTTSHSPHLLFMMPFVCVAMNPSSPSNTHTHTELLLIYLFNWPFPSHRIQSIHLALTNFSELFIFSQFRALHWPHCIMMRTIWHIQPNDNVTTHVNEVYFRNWHLHLSLSENRTLYHEHPKIYSAYTRYISRQLFVMEHITMYKSIERFTNWFCENTKIDNGWHLRR